MYIYPKICFMNKIAFLCFLSFSLLLSSCQDDLDDKIFPADQLQINNFVWSAQNIFYLDNTLVPDLGDDRFVSNEEYNEFLRSFSTPEALFEQLILPTDRFSIIVNDYRVLENALQGTRLDSGMRFALFTFEGSNQVFGFVRYVLPDSPAFEAGISRGMIFDRVNGQNLNQSTNFNQLFSGSSFSIGLAEFDGVEFQSTNVFFQLQQLEITENPIHKLEVLDFPEKKVGYLMYNGFRRNFDTELNNAFGVLQAENITELVLDLRYNGGGDVQTAVNLCSLITGQFHEEVIATQQTNDNFENSEIRFVNRSISGQALNSLQLNRVYILTTRSTASASELVISGLQPYIDVVQIGRPTTGKYQGSTTLYDSPDFRRQNASIAHRYALQPLIFKLVNSVGFTDFDEGILPTIDISEQILSAQPLVNPNETLLRAALEHMGVQFLDRPFEAYNHSEYSIIGESLMHQIDFQRMYNLLNR